MADNGPSEGPDAAAAQEALRARVKELEAAVAETKKELATKVKHYEGKLLTMTIINSALQSENGQLKEAGAGYGGGASNAEQELRELQEEFTKRLAVAEKTAAGMKEECFALRSQVEDLKRGREGLANQLAEKTAAIEQYKGEGEVLAKKTGDLEGIIKKIRVELGKAEQEKEKLQARVQILEAAAKSVEVSKSASLEEANQTVAALRQALAEQKENFNQVMASSEQQHEAELQRVREEAAQLASRSARETQERERMLSASVDALRQSLGQANQEASDREDKLREEIGRLEERCRMAEMAQEEAAARATEATRPLVRQMEGLSAHLARVESAAQEREQQLQRQVADLEAAARTAQEAQRRAEATTSAAERRAELAERAAAEARAESAAAQQQLRGDEEEGKALRERCAVALEQAHVAEEGQKQAMLALASAQQQKEAAERALQLARLELKEEAEEERRKLELEKGALEKREREMQKRQSSTSGSAPAGSGGSSGALASGSRQPAGARETNGWLEEELGGGGKGGQKVHESQNFGSGTRSQLRASGSATELEAVGGAPSAKPASSSSGALAMERLMAKVRQQAGEIAQLQRELAAATAARDHTSEELLKITQRLHTLEQEGSRTPQLQKELEELKRRHEMALVIIGERNERAEELEADLADVKALYREQVNLLVNEVDPEKWPDGYRICLFCSHCSQVQRNKRRS